MGKSERPADANAVILCDLDGTLARHYWPEDGPYEPGRIGEPIKPMLARVRQAVELGYEVQIFTARVSPLFSLDVPPGAIGDALTSRFAIMRWCEDNGLPPLEITAVKDFRAVEIWDDRARRVIEDTGEFCCAAEMGPRPKFVTK